MLISPFRFPARGLFVVWAMIIAPLSFADPAATNHLATLDVFKSPTCTCCEKWISHLQSSGFETTIHHPADLNAIKTAHGLAPRYQSCHTAISSDGYVFEGHVPAVVIQRFLAEKPVNAIGLAVPGMPMGSPGMEMGDHFTPYDVLLLTADGGSRVYAHMATAQDQLKEKP
jgi:hypothetical protein